MQIVILDAHAANPGDLSWEPLRAFGNLSVYARTEECEVARRLRGADIALVNKSRVTAETLQDANRLRLICVLATGYDCVDVAACRERGIAVCNVPAYSTEAVAQLAIALLLELTHRVGDHSYMIHKGAWTAGADFCFWKQAPVEIHGKTLGILGTGQIGLRVAQIAQAFGLRVLAHSRTQRPDFPGCYVDLDTLLAQADILSLHCPATEQTTGIIHAETLAKMREGALLINTARGALVVEQDVADALRSGKLGGYAADVLTREPPPLEHPLLGAPNCILTGHYAWATTAARERLLNITFQNVQAFLAGEELNRVC
ncbi:MAG: D-2-hydroxyacid dehydrogenase [Clostridiales bacterium]|nr:D-2-hydroxyacid dehydrogenase [Clostridiales bacterium]